MDDDVTMALLNTREGSTRIDRRMGDESSGEVGHGHVHPLRDAICSRAGREARQIGDGLKAPGSAADQRDR
jgi:hypothetical protein